MRRWIEKLTRFESLWALWELMKPYLGGIAAALLQIPLAHEVWFYVDQAAQIEGAWIYWVFVVYLVSLPVAIGACARPILMRAFSGNGGDPVSNYHESTSTDALAAKAKLLKEERLKRDREAKAPPSRDDTEIERLRELVNRLYLNTHAHLGFKEKVGSIVDDFVELDKSNHAIWTESGGAEVRSHLIDAATRYLNAKKNEGSASYYGEVISKIQSEIAGYHSRLNRLLDSHYRKSR